MNEIARGGVWKAGRIMLGRRDWQVCRRIFDGPVRKMRGFLGMAFAIWHGIRIVHAFSIPELLS
ncbi:MAG: hypothetical protein ABIR80_13490 [Opitutaceae bacterium]